ncbi:hypothetical protein ACVXHB_10390 [Escherichia coli]
MLVLPALWALASTRFYVTKKLRPQSVTSRIQPGSDVIVCAECYEQWGHVGLKIAPALAVLRV